MSTTKHGRYLDPASKIDTLTAHNDLKSRFQTSKRPSPASGPAEAANGVPKNMKNVLGGHVAKCSNAMHTDGVASSSGVAETK